MKNKQTAGLLALFFGGFGIHKFYLARPGIGFLYLLFSWTFIPAFVSLFDAIVYFGWTEKKFDKKYN